MSNNNVFPDKYRNKLEPEFLDNVNSMDTEEVKKKILEAESNIYDIENAKDNDTELLAVREKVKEFSKPYRERKSEATAKIKYCLFILENRGVSLDRG